MSDLAAELTAAGHLGLDDGGLARFNRIYVVFIYLYTYFQALRVFNSKQGTAGSSTDSRVRRSYSSAGCSSYRA